MKNSESSATNGVKGTKVQTEQTEQKVKVYNSEQKALNLARDNEARKKLKELRFDLFKHLDNLKGLKKDNENLVYKGLPQLITEKKQLSILGLMDVNETINYLLNGKKIDSDLCVRLLSRYSEIFELNKDRIKFVESNNELLKLSFKNDKGEKATVHESILKIIELRDLFYTKNKAGKQTLNCAISQGIIKKLFKDSFETFKSLQFLTKAAEKTVKMLDTINDELNKLKVENLEKYDEKCEFYGVERLQLINPSHAATTETITITETGNK